MTITYDDAVKAQSKIEDKLLEDPNIVSVGVIAEKNELGESTDSYIIKVGVISSEEYQNSICHGESLIPTEYILNDANKKKSVQIKVVQTGQIKALSALSPLSIFEKKDLPKAVDNIPNKSISLLHDYTSRIRPVPCGYSIGHFTVSAGTLGLVVEYTEGPNMGKAYLLSNNHVLAASNVAHVGDPITQPGKHDVAILERDTIAFLHRWVPLSKKVNFVDAAIAEIKDGVNWSSHVAPYVSQIGYPEDFINPTLGMRVEKTGRTTGYTTGTIISINQTVKVDYGKTGLLLFKQQICTTNMSQGGDSGSCLFEIGTKKPVGLLFAGDSSESYHNPIGSVLSVLSTEMKNNYLSGKTHEFMPDHPLKIVQKRSYSMSLTPAFRPKVNANINRSAQWLSLKNVPAKYKCVESLVKIGLCAIILKQANDGRRVSRALNSHFFFKATLNSRSKKAEILTSNPSFKP